MTLHSQLPVTLISLLPRYSYLGSVVLSLWSHWSQSRSYSVLVSSKNKQYWTNEPSEEFMQAQQINSRKRIAVKEVWRAGEPLESNVACWLDLDLFCSSAGRRLAVHCQMFYNILGICVRLMLGLYLFFLEWLCRWYNVQSIEGGYAGISDVQFGYNSTGPTILLGDNCYI